MNYTYYDKTRYKKAYELADAISQYKNSLNQEVAAFLREQADDIRALEHWDAVKSYQEFEREEAAVNWYNCGEL